VIPGDRLPVAGRRYRTLKQNSLKTVLSQPKQNAKTAMKRFSCFSQSQPVSAHVIIPLPAAGVAHKQLNATVIG